MAVPQEVTPTIQDDAKISNEEWVEKTWVFLDEITAAVEKFSQADKDVVYASGKGLLAAGTSYNHDASRPKKPPISPAKIASLKSSGGASPA